MDDVTDQTDQTSDAADAQAAPAPARAHPIKALEDFLKGHLRQTTELTSHVKTVAEMATAAYTGLTRLVGDVRSLAQRTTTDVTDIKRRLDALEAQAATTLSPDVQKAADELDKAVADVKTAMPAQAAAETEGEQPQG